VPVVIVAVAAIAVFGVGLVTKQIATATSSPTQDSRAQHSADPVVSPSAEALAPPPSPTPAPPALNPTATPYPAVAGVPARAGTTSLISAGGIPITMSIDLPAGWEKASDAMYLRPDVTPVPLSIGAWRLLHVNTFPCRWSAGVYADASSLDTAEGEALALSSWWGQDPGDPPLSNAGIAPLASKPLQTTLAGHAAWSVDVLVPTAIDLTQCDGGQLVLWDSSTAGARYALGPSEVNRLWVVDLTTGPIVIDAGLSLAASGSQKAELQAIVDSIVIAP
jgi:hypothetical protein